MASTTDLLPTHLALPDGAAQCHGVCVQQLAPGATPREHVFEPAEETSEALRGVSLGVSAYYLPLTYCLGFLTTYLLTYLLTT